MDHSGSAPPRLTPLPGEDQSTRINAGTIGSTVPPVAPPGARFDPVTGAELGAGGAERREAFALQLALILGRQSGRTEL